MSNFIDTDAIQLDSQIAHSNMSTESKNTLDKSTPCKDDINKFEDMMNGREQKTQERDSLQKQSMPKPEDIFSQMTHPLDSFFARQTVSPIQSASAESISAPNSIPEDITASLVDRILVGSPKEGGTEVRISLNNDILQNTEIQLIRGNDGTLAIKLITGDANSFQTLVESRSTLQTRLEAQGERVRIDISSEAHQEGNDSNRRSQGYMEYTPDNNQEKR